MMLSPDSVRPGDFVRFVNVAYDILIMRSNSFLDSLSTVRYVSIDRDNPPIGTIISVNYESHQFVKKFCWCYVIISLNMCGWIRLFTDEIELISRSI